MKSNPLKAHGGKTYLAKQIISHMPKHTHYVEPYFGGGAVLFAKNPEGVSEVVNDINLHLYVFWRVLSCPPMFLDFQRQIEAVPFSQIEWIACSHWPEEYDPLENMVECAARFFVKYRQSRQGLGKDFATLSRNRTRRGMNEQVSAWLSAVEGLPEAHERLIRVVILNDDALKVIKQQDGPKTHQYLDPPYLHSTRNTTNDYEYEMTEQQHDELLTMLIDIDGTFQLSGYHSELYDDWAEENGMYCVEFDLPNNASAKKTKERKTECLWMNYNPTV